MKERQFAELLKDNKDILENRFKDKIEKISLEYSLHRNGIYKTLDVYVECEKSIILIECKKQLKAHDIGQILTYNVMYGDCIDKEVKLCIAYMNCSQGELKLIEDYINMYKLNIILIEYNSQNNTLSITFFNNIKKENKVSNLNYEEKYNTCSELLSDINFFDSYKLLKFRFSGLHSIIFTLSVYCILRLTILNDVFQNLDGIIISQVIILGIIFQIMRKPFVKFITRRLNNE